jgi:hypothetical protein
MFMPKSDACATFISSFQSEALVTYNTGQFFLTDQNGATISTGTSETEVWIGRQTENLIAIPELFGRVRFIDKRTMETEWVGKFSEEDVTWISSDLTEFGSFDGTLASYDLA